MEHTKTYELCKRLIEVGKSDVVMDKIDLYFAAGHISEIEYKELTGNDPVPVSDDFLSAIEEVLA